MMTWKNSSLFYFNSSREAARNLGVGKTTINDRLKNGDRKPIADRYVFFRKNHLS